MALTNERQAMLEAEINSFMFEYNAAFASGTREDLQALVHLPVIYVSATRESVDPLARYRCGCSSNDDAAGSSIAQQPQ